MPFFTHAILLDRAFAHCPIVPTAASLRSLGRVSVPVWLIVRKDQLSICGLVSLYPTNYLILRRLIKQRFLALSKLFQIESRVMVRMAINHIVPAAVAYKAALMKELTLAKELYGNLDTCSTEVKILDRINKYVEEVYNALNRRCQARNAGFFRCLDPLPFPQPGGVSPYLQQVR